MVAFDVVVKLLVEAEKGSDGFGRASDARLSYESNAD